MEKENEQIPGGYIIKARKIKNSEISKKPPHVREVWDYLQREANHKPNDKLRIDRGQLVRTTNEIREDLKWFVGNRPQYYKKHEIETALKSLRKLGTITTAKTTRGTLITLVNYDYYQTPKNYESRTESRTDNRAKTETKPNDKQECKELNIKKGRQIYDFWDELRITPTTDFNNYKNSIEKLLEKRSFQEIKTAMVNYWSMLKESEYFNIKEYKFDRFLNFDIVNFYDLKNAMEKLIRYDHDLDDVYDYVIDLSKSMQKKLDLPDKKRIKPKHEAVNNGQINQKAVNNKVLRIDENGKIEIKYKAGFAWHILKNMNKFHCTFRKDLIESINKNPIFITDLNYKSFNIMMSNLNNEKAKAGTLNNDKVKSSKIDPETMNYIIEEINKYL